MMASASLDLAGLQAPACMPKAGHYSFSAAIEAGLLDEDDAHLIQRQAASFDRAIGAAYDSTTAERAEACWQIARLSASDALCFVLDLCLRARTQAPEIAPIPSCTWLELLDAGLSGPQLIAYLVSIHPLNVAASVLTAIEASRPGPRAALPAIISGNHVLRLIQAHMLKHRAHQQFGDLVRVGLSGLRSSKGRGFETALAPAAFHLTLATSWAAGASPDKLVVAGTLYGCLLAAPLYRPTRIVRRPDEVGLRIAQDRNGYPAIVASEYTLARLMETTNQATLAA